MKISPDKVTQNLNNFHMRSVSSCSDKWIWQNCMCGKISDHEWPLKTRWPKYTHCSEQSTQLWISHGVTTNSLYLTKYITIQGLFEGFHNIKFCHKNPTNMRWIDHNLQILCWPLTLSDRFFCLWIRFVSI